MSTDTTTGVTPPADPEETTVGGAGTEGHYEGNGASTPTSSVDGQPEGNPPPPKP